MSDYDDSMAALDKAAARADHMPAQQTEPPQSS